MNPDAVYKSPIRESHLSTEYLDYKCPSYGNVDEAWKLVSEKSMIWIGLTQVIKISNNNHWTNRRVYFQQEN